MAAGVMQSLSKFKLPAVFQHSLSATACQEMIFQDFSEEEEMEEEEEEEEEEDDEEEEEEEEERGEMKPADKLTSCSAGRGKEAAVAADTEMTQQLLRFAEHISKDIQRYFGRKSKEQDADSCNIYEDCCSPPWSARAQYYTDLLRMSQPGEPGRDEAPLGSKGPPLQPDQPRWGSLCSEAEAEKLGPLAELFEYGLCRYARAPASGHRELRLQHKYGHVAPMQGRKLPPSFWKEPSLSPLCVLSGNPPDFSDLLANWTCETSQEELHASGELAGEASGRPAREEHLGSL